MIDVSQLDRVYICGRINMAVRPPILLCMHRDVGKALFRYVAAGPARALLRPGKKL